MINQNRVKAESIVANLFFYFLSIIIHNMKIQWIASSKDILLAILLLTLIIYAIVCISERYYSGQMEPVDATVSTAMSLTNGNNKPHSPAVHSPQDK